MARLWDEAVPLCSLTLPSWLTPEDLPSYRELRSPSTSPLSSADREDFAAELQQLEDVGLIVEQRSAEAVAPRIFMEALAAQEIWSIGLYSGRSPVQLAPCEGIRNPILSRDDVTDVPATFVADPFMVRVAGIWHLFFEVMNWNSGKGEIGWATSIDGTDWQYRRIVLAEPFHLSYPYVFEWQGSYFMIPESFQAGAVRLYQASSFPMQWEFVGSLITGDYLADPSIFRHQDQWWLFVDASPAAQHDTLCLFMAKELTGPWRPHPGNPIVEGDPHHARPAGRVISWNGRLIRFAQNCAPSYGSDVRCFEIAELNSTRYREQPLGDGPVLGPGDGGWNAHGMHHVDAHDVGNDRWIACVDGWFLPGAIAGNPNPC